MDYTTTELLLTDMYTNSTVTLSQNLDKEKEKHCHNFLFLKEGTCFQVFPLEFW